MQLSGCDPQLTLGNPWPCMRFPCTSRRWSGGDAIEMQSTEAEKRLCRGMALGSETLSDSIPHPPS